MRKRFSIRYYYYFAIVLTSLLLTLATGRIEPVIVAAPFCITLILSLSYFESPKFRFAASWSKTRGFESEAFECTILVDAKSDLPLLEVFAVLPVGSELIHGTNDVFTSVGKGESRSITFAFSVPCRGVHQIGKFALRVHLAPALRSWEWMRERSLECVVFPLPDLVRTDFRPFHTQLYTGNYVSRSVGEGIEFADIRPLLPGEEPRRINWRATARTGSFVINEYAIERNADIVLLIDTFADLGSGGHTFQDYASRGAATVAHHFIQQKNRVGLIEFGYYLTYLVPKPGLRQWYDIVDRLARLEMRQRYVTYKVATIPRKILPPRALVLAFTSFLDERFVEALADLKSRGFDVVAVHISPVQLQEKVILLKRKQQRYEHAALRIWRLEEQARINQIYAHGIQIVHWNVDLPFALVTRSLEMMRQERVV